MNLALLDREVFTLPEVIEDRLTPPTTADDVIVCAFNRRGNLLAGGCKNGAVVVWDFDTHGVARVLVGGHAERVTSVSWTRSSRRILSSSADGTVVVWDVLKGEAVHTAQLGAEVHHAALHPRKRSLCMACVGGGGAGQVLLVSLPPAAASTVPLLASLAKDGADGGKASALTVACFDATGDRALVGSSRGAVHVVPLDAGPAALGTPLLTVQLPGGSALKSIMLSRDGKSFVANSADRVIRAYSLERALAGERPAPRELQDVVNRVQWAHAGFSSESEHVIGSAHSATDHSVYIWDMHTGELCKILDGPKDGALHFAYHPTRPIVACCARSGAIYVWTKRYSENWSAFAPDFKELEENEEYCEREDEFDIKPAYEGDKKAEDEEEEAIDVTTLDKTELAHIPDADDADDELLFLPTVPDTEAGAEGKGAKEEEDGKGGKRKRKSLA